MDGDLSLSKSLGGLRIANPDDVSPGSTKDDPVNLVSSVLPMPSSPPAKSNGDVCLGSQRPPSLPASGFLRSPSPLDFNPKAFSTDPTFAAPQPNPAEKQQSPAAKERSSYAQRYANRISIPLTYQDQQQAQFPQYPTMMPLTQRNPSFASRPVSAAYTQSPGAVANGDMSKKDGSYRLRNQSSRSSMLGLPQRSSSRGALTAMQAGVPSNEGNHTDRSYKQSQQSQNGNGPLPPRRSSRGMGGLVSTAGEPVATPASGSPVAPGGGQAASSEDWQERGAAVGQRQELDANGKLVTRHVKKGVKDFQFGRTLGEGSYSTVMAATDRQTGKEYAIKVLDKKHIIKEKKVKYVSIEKETLNRLTDHPGVVRLYYTFQDIDSLYFVLDLATGGELLGVLKRMTTFDEECTRFYAAQILDTIDFMHARGVIHRDLKPENVLLDDQMHVKITDFGTAKMLENPNRTGASSNDVGGSDAGSPMDGRDTRANSFVGTAEYVSPELLTDKNACKASDLWAFGCIIYQLLAGRPPFKAGNEYLTFQKIVALDYEFPKGFSEVAKDLIERLLVLEPSRRLSIEHIKNHQFFYGIVWGRGLWRQKAPRLRSFVPSASAAIKSTGHSSSNLNGGGNGYPPNVPRSHSTSATHFEGGDSGGSSTNNLVKPSPRIITELPPPSQLDIEWSPVLTRTNERILKLGNLCVLSSPAPHSPNSRNGTQNGDDAPKKFSRFFGGNAAKKRQRLVMVTSSARIIIVAAGGEEKKTKTEIPLLSAGCAWRKMQDAKGLTYWCVDTVSRTFEMHTPTVATNVLCSGTSTSRLRTQGPRRQMALLLLWQHKSGLMQLRVLEKWLSHRAPPILTLVTKPIKHCKGALPDPQMTLTLIKTVVPIYPAVIRYKGIKRMATKIPSWAGKDSASGNRKMGWRLSSENSIPRSPRLSRILHLEVAF